MISVCIATHNGAQYIVEQIDSILSQLSIEDEIVISDDGSNDNTIDLIKSIADKRIKLFCWKNTQAYNTHQGFYYATANFENALKNAKGDYIFLCDQDDIWYDNKVRICVERLKAFDYVKHDYTTIDGAGVIKERSKYRANEYLKWNFYNGIKNLPFRGCCMAFNRKVIDKALPFPKHCFQHDSWIGMSAIMNHFSFSYIDQPLIYHRVHGENVSELKTPNSLGFKIKYRLILLAQLINDKF